MIQLTHQAADRVKSFLSKRGQGLGIRLGVKAVGCSGFGYVLEYVDTADSKTVEYDSHGVKIFVDSQDLIYLDGVTLDWQRQGLNEGFKFNNPNEKSACGCGQSFSI